MSNTKAAYKEAVLLETARRTLPKCIVCGAEEGRPCTYNSSYEGNVAGDIRPQPHFYRG